MVATGAACESWLEDDSVEKPKGTCMEPADPLPEGGGIELPWVVNGDCPGLSVQDSNMAKDSFRIINGYRLRFRLNE